MSFQPIIPASGLAGWAFLQRTYDAQTDAFNTSPVITRDTEYFNTRIAQVNNAEDLVTDRRLLRVALGAFGLEDDLNNKFFIRKILEEGTINPSSLANKMSDSRYTAISSAFGFDLGVPNTKLSNFADEIIEKYRAQQFRVAVGEQNQDMRLALNAKQELSEIASGSESEKTRWYQIMGNAPLRTVMETALGLPDSFSQIDLEQQQKVFADKAKRQLGIKTLDDLAKDDVMTKMVERFLLRSEVKALSGSSPASIALTLLQAR